MLRRLDHQANALLGARILYLRATTSLGEDTKRVLTDVHQPINKFHGQCPNPSYFQARS